MTVAMAMLAAFTLFFTFLLLGLTQQYLSKNQNMFFLQLPFVDATPFSHRDYDGKTDSIQMSCAQPNHLESIHLLIKDPLIQ